MSKHQANCKRCGAQLTSMGQEKICAGTVHSCSDEDEVNMQYKEKYYMYFDESNNFRSFNLKNGRFNLDINQVFVLGGIAYKKGKPNISFNELKDVLKLQNNVKEIKFNKLFSKGDFMETISNKRVSSFLGWLVDSEAYIHYIAMDYFYYATVDIIDSIINWRIINDDYNAYFNIKSILYYAMKEDIETVCDIFNQFHFPNIRHGYEMRMFMENILGIVDKYPSKEKDKKTLIKLLRHGINRKKLPFIQDNTDNVMQNNLADIYLSQIKLYKGSLLFFDEELKIQEILSQVRSEENDDYANFCFLDSKSELLLQLSDVVSGLIAQLISYINKNDYSYLKMGVSNLSDIQLDCIKMIKKIRLKSDLENKSFIVNIMPQKEIDKLNFLLDLGDL